MKAKIILLFIAFLAATLCLNAQEQPQQGQSQGGNAQSASVMNGSAVDGQGIKKYLLGPGDTLDVRVFGNQDLNWIGEVDADGTLSSLPFIDKPIVAQCRTDKEVQKDIVAAYSKFLKNPQISVRVIGRNSRPPATVLGAVLQPTRAQMMRRIRLSELITASGGVTERANGDIQVMHTLPVMCPEPDEVVEPLVTDEGLAANTIKIYKFTELMAGKSEANPLIRPGDIVNVLEAKPVYITGVVNSPQPVLLREGLTLTKAIGMVGGVRSGDAKSSDVRIYRSKPGSIEPPEVVRVDLDAIKKGKREDVLLQPYDIVEVPKVSDYSPMKLLKAVAGTVTNLPVQAFQYKVIY